MIESDSMNYENTDLTQEAGDQEAPIDKAENESTLDKTIDKSSTEGDSEDNLGKKTKKAIKKLENEIIMLKASLDKANKQYDEVNDKYLRMIAEYDNFRRRTTKEKDGLYSDTVCDIVKLFLPIIDNLERAVQYTPDANDEGIAMIIKNYLEILSGLGVAEIAALGKAFDPNLHYAIMHIDDEQYGENEIYNVVQKGYCMGDKVIRHAMVMVAN